MIQRPDNFILAPGHPLWEGCVAAYLGGGDVGSMRLWDSSGRDNHGTLTNMLPADWQWSAELGRVHTRFLGTNRYIDLNTEMPDAGGLFAAADRRWSVSLWTRVAPGATGTPIGRASATTTNRTFQIYFHDDTSPGVYIRGARTFTDFGFRDNLWHHYGVTWDGATATLYTDGVAFGAISVGVAAEEAGQRVIIGARTNGTGFPLTGDTTDALIHNRALTPAEITDLARPDNAMLSDALQPGRRVFFPGWSQGKRPTTKAITIRRRTYSERPDSVRLNPDASLAEGLVLGPDSGAGVGSMQYRDTSLYGNNGVLTNMSPADWQWSAELGRWVLDFGSITNPATVVMTDEIWLGHTFTVSAWLRSNRTDYTGGKPGVYLLRQWDAADTTRQWAICFGDSFHNGDELNFMSAKPDGTFQASSQVQSSYRLTTDLTHLAVRVSRVSDTSTFWSTFVNGRFIDTVQTLHGHARLGASTGLSLPLTNRNWDGILADTMLHERHLSDAEIQALADPSNVMLESGNGPLLLPERRVTRPVVLPTFNPAWAAGINQHIGFGLGT